MNYTWLVKDIKELMSKSQTRSSPTDDEGWKLIVGVEEGKLKRLFIALDYLYDGFVPWGKKVTIRVINPKFVETSFSMSRVFRPDPFDLGIQFNLFPYSEIKRYIHDNVLKIVMNITEVDEDTQTSPYESLMDNQTLSDVQLLVGDVKFSAHKVVLHANSPVFEKMFSSEMKESIANEVEIKEMRSEIFQELLRYMYTGKVKNLKEKAQDILVAADRYQMKEIILICSDFLGQNINLQNVTELLKLAEDHNAGTLKEFCSEFIMQNYRDFVCSEGYKDLIKTHMKSFVEIATQIGLKCRVTLYE